ncbi:MAG: hypothetical protein HYZ53_07115 [Planctomycetes bacterium]|nr:hypothetical protein [Planctomycetota bacterium]
MDLILRRLGLPDRVNDFHRVAVEPLSQEDARILLLGLCEGAGTTLSSAAEREFFRLIDPSIPYFIQLFCDQVAADCGGSGREVTPEDVEAVYRKRVLGPACRHYFDHYRDRLKRYGPARERAARGILDAVARSEQGRVGEAALYDAYLRSRRRNATEDEFNEILADLECEFYLLRNEATNEYYFFLNVMRDWWRRWYPKRAAGPSRPVSEAGGDKT